MEAVFGLSTTLINFVIALSVVVFVHEWGHYFVARRNNVHCEAFSIGFGPELFGWTDKLGTRWKVCAIPLGGYVKMFGEGKSANPGDPGEEPIELTEDEKAVSFKYKSLGQRAAIVFAGPAVNFVFAIVVFLFLFMAVGRVVTAPVIGEISAGSAAEEAGLMAGDRILSVNGENIDRFEEMLRLVPLGNGAPMTLLVDRGGVQETITATPKFEERDNGFGEIERRPLLGIASNGETQVIRVGPVKAMELAFTQSYVIVESTIIAVGQMIRGERGMEDLGGPIRIAEYSDRAAQAGLFTFISFLAILSLNLGFINLLPIPLLDGGHLLFYAIEALRGRPLGEHAQEWGLRIGLAFVLTLMVVVTFNDIARLITR